jgi:NADH-quinone oxidoreductase subunit N
MLEKLHIIQHGIPLLRAEILLTGGICTLVFLSLFKKINPSLLIFIGVIFSVACIVSIITDRNGEAVLFEGMLQKESFSANLKLLMNLAAVLTLLMSFRTSTGLREVSGEYAALLLTIVLGGHLLVMSNNLLMVFLSLEMISISSYVLAGFASGKKGSEGSLKYFLFGSVASAIMLYGFTILYGLTGTLDFSTELFARKLIENHSTLVLIAGVMALSGFLFKISAAPMHLWTPDVYESTPMPVIAFFSVAPKLAGFGIFSKFILAMNAYGQTTIDWQTLVSIIAMLTITVGNFSALAQQNAKRMMAYSSIAQSGFLMVGIASFLAQGLHFLLFYAWVYVIMNFLVFIYLQYFENRGIENIPDYAGIGKRVFWPTIFILTGLISLTGLPPTAGFSAKLFIFSSLWESYQLSGKSILLWLLVFGLINTVVSLFYYLKIPYYAFIKERPGAENTESSHFQGFGITHLEKILTPENLLGLILVLLVLVFFFMPGLLMGWINKVNFVF